MRVFGAFVDPCPRESDRVGLGHLPGTSEGHRADMMSNAFGFEKYKKACYWGALQHIALCLTTATSQILESAMPMPRFAQRLGGG